MLPITEITAFTFQDFPENTACIIWLGGCSFRCPYCHNPEFIVDKFRIMEEEKVWEFLNSRKGLLDGVVLSGGECMLSPEIIEFGRKIKAAGFKLKIDTNGSFPARVKEMATENLLDFVALDYKAPKDKFMSIAGRDLYNEFHETLEFLCSGNIPFEVRTTVHTDLINEDDIAKIIEDLEGLNYTGSYYVQNFIENSKGRTLGNVSPQKRVLNRNELPEPKGFKLEFRNF